MLCEGRGVVEPFKEPPPSKWEPPLPKQPDSAPKPLPPDVVGAAAEWEGAGRGRGGAGTAVRRCGPRQPHSTKCEERLGREQGEVAPARRGREGREGRGKEGRRGMEGEREEREGVGDERERD